MAEVDIYTSFFCGFCYRAKSLLDRKEAKYNEIDIMLHPSRRAEMIERAAGMTSVPQIFINGAHIGGSDELSALEQEGRLDDLLAAAP
jgi:glutaredoxin 3